MDFVYYEERANRTHPSSNTMAVAGEKPATQREKTSGIRASGVIVGRLLAGRPEE